MNRDELVEKVAKALCDTEWGDGIWGKPGLLSQMEQDAYNGLATAAIDIALEEAARVADDKTIGANSNDVFDAGWASACADIAAAIRAMKGKD